MLTTELTDWHRVTGDDTPRDTVAAYVSGHATAEQIEEITRVYVREIVARLPYAMSVATDSGLIYGEPGDPGSAAEQARQAIDAVDLGEITRQVIG